MYGVFVRLQVVGVADSADGIFVNAANHASQLPHPQVQLQVHQRPQRRIQTRIFTPPSNGDQCAQGTQAQLRVPIGGPWQAASQALQHGSDGGRPGAVQHPQQVHEGGVLAQLPAKRETPFPRFEPPVRNFPEEHLVLRPDVLVGRSVSARGSIRSASPGCGTR